ncbi:hypothetical protein [Streptomyces iconiensis]|uniref:Secreted protein n=1 Tax=Streptomyces iconiensis TaxID=1384038 RepID=A0ABT6ZW05_9ACTN|nr:hypothetical protein [Streptomyces iconiensis]MDJ1133252.1 hypothetical protein [Streptomyces iconiensis]
MTRGARVTGGVAGAVLLLASVAGCGGQEKAAPEEKPKAAAPRLQHGAPPAKVLKLHQLALPPEARRVAYVQDNGWSSYGLALSFQIPESRLAAFLREARVPKSSLEPGFYLEDVGTETAGWKKRPGRNYLSGVSTGTRTPAPSHDITIDVTDRPERVTVYVTSVHA